jgi:hypothetical protein
MDAIMVAMSGFKYGDGCRVCYHGKHYVKHDCAATVTVERSHVDGVDVWVAVLVDGLGFKKHVCEHAHMSSVEAFECGETHVGLHQKGQCDCGVFFIKPAPVGVHHNAVGKFYIVVHFGLKAIKVGITGRETLERLEEHTSEGWVVFALWDNVNLLDAYRVEQGTVAKWRKQGFPPAVAYGDMRQGGATETVSMKNVSRVALYATVKEVSKKLNSNPVFLYSSEAKP